jgi:hypothetical protein
MKKRPGKIPSGSQMSKPLAAPIAKKISSSISDIITAEFATRSFAKTVLLLLI